MKYVLLLASIFIIAAEVYLWHTDAISGVIALLSIFIGELLLALVALALALRHSRKTEIPLTTLIPPLHLIVLEAHMFIDFYRVLRGDVQAPQGSTTLPATTGLWTLPSALTAVTAIEIIALELLLPWPIARGILVVLSIYSLIWLWAIIGQRAVYPHYFTQDALVLRRGRTVVATLTRIDAITLERNFDSDPYNITEDILILASSEGSNVRIRCQPTPAKPFRWPWTNVSPKLITQVKLWIDDPESLQVLINQRFFKT